MGQKDSKGTGDPEHKRGLSTQRNVFNCTKSGKKDFKTNNVNTFAVLPKLNCFYTNADQFPNKLAEFKTRIRDSKPNIIGHINETNWVTFGNEIYCQLSHVII